VTRFTRGFTGLTCAATTKSTKRYRGISKPRAIENGIARPFFLGHSQADSSSTQTHEPAQPTRSQMLAFERQDLPAPPALANSKYRAFTKRFVLNSDSSQSEAIYMIQQNALRKKYPQLISSPTDNAASMNSK